MKRILLFLLLANLLLYLGSCENDDDSLPIRQYEFSNNHIVVSKEATDIEKRNVMSLQLTAADGLTINGKQEDISRLRQKVMTFVGTTADRQQHIITLEIDRRASYEAYFNIQNEIMAAYHALRDSYAIKTYGHSYDTCSPEQRDAVRSYYPQRITETTIGSEEEGGGK